VFRAAGFPCPLYTNPADHLLDVVTPHKISEENISFEEQVAVDDAIIRCQPPLRIDLNMGVTKRLIQMANLPLNPIWIKQIEILSRRNLREQSRKLNITVISLIQTIIMAVLLGTAFLNVGNTQRSILRREGVLFFCIINQGVFGALTLINSFPVERTLTLRERASGTYFASAYFTAKIITDTLVQLPIPIIFVRKIKIYILKVIGFRFIVMYCLFSCWFRSISRKVFAFYNFYYTLFNCFDSVSINGICSMSNNRYECYCSTNGS
jgi:hypothetical protein